MTSAYIIHESLDSFCNFPQTKMHMHKPEQTKCFGYNSFNVLRCDVSVTTSSKDIQPRRLGFFCAGCLNNHDYKKKEYSMTATVCRG